MRYAVHSLLTGFFTICFLFVFSVNYAQSPPQGFDYQAVARDTGGNVMDSVSMTVRFRIHKSSATGTIVWEEEHNVSTNQYGLFTAIIGQGTKTGGSLSNFSDINWQSDQYYLEVDLNISGSYIDMGTTQLVSVPYSMMAGKADTAQYAQIADTSLSGGGGGTDNVDSTVQVTPRLTGDGTSTNPLDIAQQSANPGQVLEWNGTNWVPAEDDTTTAGTGDDWGSQVVQSDTTLTGDGTSTSPLGISQQGANSGEALKWNGSSWAPATDSFIAQTTDTSHWNKNGSDLYYNNGFVGIGTNTPTAHLEINKTHAGIFLDAINGDAYIFADKTNKGGYTGTFHQTGGTDEWSVGMLTDNNYNIAHQSFTPDGTFMIDSATQNIGIGTTNPNAGLHTKTSQDSVIFAEYTGTQNGIAIQATTRPGNGLGYGTYISSQYFGDYITVDASGSGIGVGGYADVGGGTGDNYGYYGYAHSTTGITVGIYGYAAGSGTNYGVYGVAGGGTTDWAGYFSGKTNTTDTAFFQSSIQVNGDVNATGTKNFKIDHPQDPGNKFLIHSAVESPEMTNMYSGNVELDENGEAVVQLPDYFEAVNTDYRYTLTPVGAPMPNLYVAEKIKDNTFKIAGGESGKEVSWQVVAQRNDPYAREHPTKDVVEKPENRKGKYLNPELYGQPKSKSMYYQKQNNQAPPNKPPLPDKANDKKEQQK